jgi:hypothetical protein
MIKAADYFFAFLLVMVACLLVGAVLAVTWVTLSRAVRKWRRERQRRAQYEAHRPKDWWSK